MGKQGGRVGGRGAGGVAACGIAGFLAVCLTDMVGVLNRSNKESHSAAGYGLGIGRGRNANSRLPPPLRFLSKAAKSSLTTDKSVPTKGVRRCG